MKTKIILVVTTIGMLCGAGSARAGTVSYWRFEGDGGGAPTTGEAVAHTSGRTTAVVSGGPVAIDVSGNGNTLYAWDASAGGLDYTNAVPGTWTGSDSNEFSAVSASTDPRAFSWSTQSAPSGVDLDTMQPLAWTIEASVYLDPSAASGWRTFIGRDGYDVNSGDVNVASLYFQKTSGGYLRIQFVDVAGNQWVATDSEPFQAGRWYHVAAQSDGSQLRLYKWDTTVDAGYELVASTDISSADARLKADTIDSTTLPLDTPGEPMNWSVGSGMWGSGGSPEDGHVDRWIGMIDEIRISDHAVDPAAFLFNIPVAIAGSGVVEPGRFWLEWQSISGAYYGIDTKTNLMDSNWVAKVSGIPGTPPLNSWTSEVLTAEHTFYRLARQTAPSVFDIDPGTVLNGIDENVYGHFFEHIYHSANGGLWGDLIWNRSFELNNGPAGGIWSVEGNELVQSSLSTDVHMEFGDPAWTDYELTLEAQKDGGSEGFLIIFRADDENNFYWLNLGGWNNTQHAIEKEVNGGRSLVSSQIPGTINTPPPDTWYTIRIRCEGNRFQCWLDGGLIFDITDTSSPFLSGAVGVGTWSTQARFRNIEVKDLSGTTLYSGLPTPPPSGVSDYWTLHGGGSGSIVTDALNNAFAVEIAGSGSETGLQQDNFKFIPQLYTGSLWMKGSVPSGLKVEFLDGSNTIAQTTLSAPTGSWAEYPFSLTPASSTDDGSMRITLLGAGTVTIDQVSMMGQDSIDTGGYRPDLLAAVTNLNAPIIRWPGGCFASLYFWKDAIGPQHQRTIYPAYMWEDQDINSYGTDEFIRMCEMIGTEPLICINSGVLDYSCGAYPAYKHATDAEYLTDALDWMEYCNGDTNTTWGAIRAANGHPEPYNVTYWEIDNETWAAGSAAYIAKVLEFAPAMRAKAVELGMSDIKLIAVGAGGYDQSWNQDILDYCAAEIDYISVHYYEDPGNYATAPLAYENYITDLAGRIAASANPDVEIYNSEWNAQSIDLRTGLFAGGILNVFERQGDVFTLGGPALFLRHTSAGGWNNAFMNFDHTGWFPAPNYIVMKLWRDHYAPWRVDVSGDAGDLNIVATKSDDDSTVYVKVINPSATERHAIFQLPGGTSISDASFKYVTGPSLYTQNSMANPNAVGVASGTASIHGEDVDVTLPPYSASVIEINL